MINPVIKFIEDFQFKMKPIGNCCVVIRGSFKLEDDEIYPFRYYVSNNDIIEFMESLAGENKEPVDDIIANNNSVYVSICRNHIIIKEEYIDHANQFAIEDSSEFIKLLWFWYNKIFKK